MTDSRYVCVKCQRMTDEWERTCPLCSASLSYVKSAVTAKSLADMVVTLGQYEPHSQDRIVTGFAPWDKLVGGGMVLGTTVVVGGQKGFGKSTLILQLASLINAPTLIVSAEEQIESIAQRASRTGVLETERKDGKVSIVHTSATEDLLHAIEVVDPLVIFIDSMNKFMSRRHDMGGTFGSGTQMKYLIDQVRDICDKRRKVGVVIGQVRSDGNIAGPNMILHDVDVVLYIRKDRQDKSMRRLGALKNRLGDAEVITVAKMTSMGLVDPMQGSEATYTERMLESDGEIGIDDNVFGSNDDDGDEDEDEHNESSGAAPAQRSIVVSPTSIAKVVELSSRKRTS